MPATLSGTGQPRRAGRSASTDSLLSDAAAGTRLFPEEFIQLYSDASTLDLGAAADARRRALHPDGTVTYIIDRNVNYTNVCVCLLYTSPSPRD